MNLTFQYPPKPPRSGRWGTRDALLAHIAERHGRPASDFDQRPHPLFGGEGVEFDLPLLRRMHAAWHEDDAGPDHDH